MGMEQIRAQGGLPGRFTNRAEGRHVTLTLTNAEWSTPRGPFVKSPKPRARGNHRHSSQDNVASMQGLMQTAVEAAT